MKVVIPAAGLGTRLLPATKEQPKEMLPLFAKASDGQPYLKPLLQLVFEQLYDLGLREFCFVIGREKRAIEDHFTPEPDYIKMLEKLGKDDVANELAGFYRKVEKSKLVWVNQPEPRGFGDAVLRAAPFVGDDLVFVHAGDTYIISGEAKHLKELICTHKKMDADMTCLIREVENPRQFGVVEVEKVAGKLFKLKKVVEKPEKPKTNLAIMPIYIFRPAIFKALGEVPPGKGNEIQLSDGIQSLIDSGLACYAIKLTSRDIWLDIGTIETYWNALKTSFERAVG
ncbi:MAG: sugar phosphate nucleotidyltransferase [Candidatus Hadarchaeota archaeon]